MAHHHYYHFPSLIKEIIILVLVNFAAFVFFSYVDALEWIYEFSRAHEDYELDEIIPLGASIATTLLVFSYRRIVELGNITKAYEQLSLRDPLTHILNRRAGQIALSRWEKSATPFAVIQVDLDDFKSFNNLYGPSVGDEILIKIADLLTEISPKHSEIIRWIDDNFLIIAPLSTNSPYDIGNNIIDVFEKEFSSSVTPVTCGIGISISQKNEPLSLLMERVEDALIHAKSQGKNKIKAA